MVPVGGVEVEAVEHAAVVPGEVLLILILPVKVPIMSQDLTTTTTHPDCVLLPLYCCRHSGLSLLTQSRLRAGPELRARVRAGTSSRCSRSIRN